MPMQQPTVQPTNRLTGHSQAMSGQQWNSAQMRRLLQTNAQTLAPLSLHCAASQASSSRRGRRGWRLLLRNRFGFPLDRTGPEPAFGLRKALSSSTSTAILCSFARKPMAMLWNEKKKKVVSSLQTTDHLFLSLSLSLSQTLPTFNFSLYHSLAFWQRRNKSHLHSLA